MKFSKKNGGFTLVELIVVIAILAILAAIAVPAYSGYISKANEAADQQLLAAVNTAYAAACLENNVDMLTMSSAAMPIDPATGKIMMDKVNPYGENFKVYFGQNSDSAFKTIKALYLKDGVFMKASEPYANAYNNILANYTTQVGAVQNSAFGTVIGATDLLNQVDSVAGLANGLIANGSTLSNVVMTPAYLETLANTMDMTTEELDSYMNTLSDEEYFNFLANSTVLNVATTMNDPSKMDETETLNMLQNANFGGLGTTLNTDPEKGLAQAALLYGMYTAYNPDAAKELDSVDDLTGLMSDDAFKTYLSQVNTEGSQAQKDYQGYKSALEIVNGAVEDSPEVADQILNGSYSDPELVGLLGSIIGG